MEKFSYDALESENYQKIAEAVGDANPILDVGCGEGRLMPKTVAMIDYARCHPEMCDHGVSLAVLECEYGSLVQEGPTRHRKRTRPSGATATLNVI